MAYLRFVLLGLALGVSTAFAATAPCPAPPSGVNYDTNAGIDYFQRWCLSIGGTPGQDLARGITMGCFKCPDIPKTSTVSPPVALFVGVPVLTGSLAAVMKLAGESTKDPNVVSETDDPTAGYGQAFAVGAGVGLGGVLVSYGIVKVTQASPTTGLTLLGGLTGGAVGVFNQSLKNDKKTPAQRDAEKESGKRDEDYKKAAMQSATIGAGIGLVGGLAKGRFSDLVRLPSGIRNNRLVRRTDVISSPSLLSGTRIGVVFR